MKKHVWVCWLMTSACGSENLVHTAGGDLDGDGVQNGFDCSPLDASVSGDRDGDGWIDVRCLERGNYPLWGPPTGDHVYLDCDDDDSCVHPGGVPGEPPAYYEVAPPAVPAEAPWTDSCDPARWPITGVDDACFAGSAPFERPSWAVDSVDNDCDGNVDVEDFDRDGVVAGPDTTAVDCDDCRVTVNPGIDEFAVDAALCPVYAWDDVDNDCEGSPLMDFDGDGVVGEWWGNPVLDLDYVECAAAVNLTTGRTDAELVAALWAAAAPTFDALQPASGDCDDLDALRWPGAPEQCDATDWDCDGAPFSGFEVREGLRVVYVEPGRVVGADPPPEVAPTGQTPERALPSVASTKPYLAWCHHVALLPGDAEEAAELIVAALSTDAYPEVCDPAVDEVLACDVQVDGNVARPDACFRIVAESPGESVLRGAGTRSLVIRAASDQQIEISGIEIVGDEDRRGGLVLDGGSARLVDVKLLDVSEPGASALAAFGCNMWMEGLVAESNGGLGAVSVISGQIDVRDSTFRDNTGAAFGGALQLVGFVRAYVGGPSGTTFEANAAEFGGGLYAAGAALTLEDLVFLDNLADFDGGGAYVVSDGSGDQAAWARLTFERNAALGIGGGISAVLAQGGTIDDLVARDNVAGVDGGGAFVVVSAGGLTGTDWELHGNVAGGNGGGALVSAIGTDGVMDAVTLSVVRATGNRAEGSGGGLWLSDDTSVNVTDLAALDGGLVGPTSTAGLDGGLAAVTVADGSVVVTGLTVVCDGVTDAAGRDGGAVHVDGSDVTLTGADVLGCIAVGRGGAAFVDADVALVDGDFEANEAEAGGALAFSSSADIEGENAITVGGVFHDNVASALGGALYLEGGSYVVGPQADAARSEFQGNSSGGSGGAVFVESATYVTVTDTDFEGPAGAMAAVDDGGAVAVKLASDVVLARVSLVDLLAGGDGGCLSVDTATRFVLGDGADPFPSVTLRECGAMGNGGALSLLSAQDWQATGVDWSGNAANGFGHHAYVASVSSGTLAYSNLTGGGVAASCPECQGDNAVHLGGGQLLGEALRIAENPGAGAAVASFGEIVLQNVLVEENGSDMGSGSIRSESGALVLHASTVRANQDEVYIDSDAFGFLSCSLIESDLELAVEVDGVAQMHCLNVDGTGVDALNTDDAKFIEDAGYLCEEEDAILPDGEAQEAELGACDDCVLGYDDDGVSLGVASFKTVNKGGLAFLTYGAEDGDGLFSVCCGEAVDVTDCDVSYTTMGWDPTLAPPWP